MTIETRGAKPEAAPIPEREGFYWIRRLGAIHVPTAGNRLTSYFTWDVTDEGARAHKRTPSDHWELVYVPDQKSAGLMAGYVHRVGSDVPLEWVEYLAVTVEVGMRLREPGDPPSTRWRCKHGGLIDDAYQCPDCTQPKPQAPMAAEERYRRWVDWALSVLQPLGVGATDEAMRQGIAEDFVGDVEEATRDQLRAHWVEQGGEAEFGPLGPGPINRLMGEILDTVRKRCGGPGCPGWNTGRRP